MRLHKFQIVAPEYFIEFNPYLVVLTIDGVLSSFFVRRGSIIDRSILYKSFTSEAWLTKIYKELRKIQKYLHF